jgi:hypothetical protein
MNLEYAKAYGTERQAHAAVKRFQREVASVGRTRRVTLGGPSIQTSLGKALIRIGMKLSEHPTRPSSATGAATGC